MRIVGLPEYVYRNLKNKVAEVRIVYPHRGYTEDGVEIFKTKSGYAVIGYSVTYCNFRGVVEKCFVVVYSRFKVKTTELENVLKEALNEVFPVKCWDKFEYEVDPEVCDKFRIECTCIDKIPTIREKLHEFVKAILNGLKFEITEKSGAYARTLY